MRKHTVINIPKSLRFQVFFSILLCFFSGGIAGISFGSENSHSILAANHTNEQILDLYDNSPKLLKLEGSKQRYSLLEYMTVFQDDTGRVPFRDIRRLAREGLFESESGGYHKVGYTQGRVWIRFRVENISHADYQWIYRAGSIMLDEISVYEIDADGNVNHRPGGTIIPPSDREMMRPYHPFPFVLKPGDTREFFISYRGQTWIDINGYLTTSIGMVREEASREFICAFFFGFMLCLILYNIFVYFSLRDINYFHYVCHLTVTTFVILMQSGWLDFALGGIPGGWGDIPIMARTLNALTAVYFTMGFLDTKNLQPRMHKILKASCFVPLLIFIVPLTPLDGFQGSLCDIYFAYLIPVLFAAGILSLVNRYQPAIYYVLSWGSLLLSVLIFMLARYGMIGQSFYTDFAPIFGNAVIMVVFSFGLRSRLTLMRNEWSVRLQTVNEQLEKKVENRTRDLDMANKKLMNQQVEIISSAKKVALTEMAANMSHEINDPLAILQFCTEQLFLFQDNHEKYRDLSLKRIKSMDRSIEKIVNIVAKLRQFSKIENFEEDQSINLVDILNDAVDMTRKKFLDDTLEIKVEGKIEGLQVMGIRSDLIQVVYNLLQNAYVYTRGLSDQWIHISVVTKDSNVHIAIEDSGRGISKKIQSKIFEPFFTTSNTNQGTGLGLSFSQGIIESHNGKLYYNAASRHTCFVIELPLEAQSIKSDEISGNAA